MIRNQKARSPTPSGRRTFAFLIDHAPIVETRRRRRQFRL